jgi:predicted RNA-binding protein with PIN domain
VSRTAGPDGDVPPPAAGALEALPSDDWAALIPAIRAGLQELADHEVTPTIRRLRAAPTSRLAGGRVRRELCAVLARGGPPWVAVVTELEARDGLPPALSGLARGQGGTDQGSAMPRSVARSDDTEASLRRPRDDADRARVDADRARVDADRARADAERARARLREVRDERDAARRQAAGAERRATAAETALEGLRDELAQGERRRSELEQALADAADERRRAVEREARRREAEVERLRTELASLRRAEEAQRLAARRRDDARRQAARRAQETQAQARREALEQRTSRIRPGRPSVLPAGVAPDTAEAVDALLHPGRLVLVDGYNLTLQHQGHLPLETQRTWLTQLLATLAAQRRVRPVVVFDGERAGGGRPLTGSREVEVRFTPAGIAADDEVVLTVEATDEPVLVVTDDRELRARVLAGGADVVGTAPFLGAVR